jgi:hypothetical protein
VNGALVRCPSASARALDFRIAIFARESVPMLIIGIPLGDGAVTFRRFVSTQVLERTFTKAIEINVPPCSRRVPGSNTCSRDNSSLLSSRTRSYRPLSSTAGVLSAA